MNRIKAILDEKGVKQTWLAEKLQKSYNMVNSYVKNRRQPSLDDLFRIAEILGVDVRDLLDKDSFIKQEDDGVQSSHNDATEDNVVSAETINIPLLGSISCGTPIFAVENIEAEIPVSVELIKPTNKYFLLRAKGDSMNEKGINDGDLVLVKQQQTAENRDNVVALIDDEATIKEFHHNGDTIVLKPRSTNKKYQPIILTSDFRIQGIVITTISL